MNISRRFFLAIAAAAVPLNIFGQEEVPALLDHILLGCNDLDRGIAFVEQKTGVRAAFGGAHPGRGTRNALVSLAEPASREPHPRRYLEIIAPDPQQSGAPDFLGLQSLAEPRLVGWAARPGDIQALAKRLVQEGIPAQGPTPGSRKTPDGLLLQWKTLNLKDNASGLLPFFIEWSAGSPHPSVTAPSGCHLDRFEILTPDSAALAKKAKQLGLNVEITKAASPQLRATIKSTRVEFVLTS